MPRFRLETALKVRERLEKLYQKALAEQVQIQQELRDQRQLMERALDSNNLNLDQSKSTGFTIKQMQMSDYFRERMTLQMEVNQNQLKEQEQVIELKRQELTRATQKKRVLEILKEKEQQRFEEEMDRQERMEADEIAQGLRRYSVQWYQNASIFSSHPSVRLQNHLVVYDLNFEKFQLFQFIIDLKCVSPVRTARL